MAGEGVVVEKATSPKDPIKRWMLMEYIPVGITWEADKDE